jgi:uncharacterized protein YfiM (DUF2279 family)
LGVFHGQHQSLTLDNVTSTFNKETAMKAIIAILTLLLATQAHADSWTGQDKTKHAIAGAAIGSAVTLATGNHWHGCAASTAVGLAKEVYDHQHRDRHTPSFKDFAVTAVAGCLSSKTTLVFIGHDKVVFTWRF